MFVDHRTGTFLYGEPIAEALWVVVTRRRGEELRLWAVEAQDQRAALGEVADRIVRDVEGAEHEHPC